MTLFQNFKSFSEAAAAKNASFKYALTLFKVKVPHEKVDAMLNFEDRVASSRADFSYESAAIDSSGGVWRDVTFSGRADDVDDAMALFASFGLNDVTVEGVEPSFL